MHASMMACAISSIFSALMPSSRARLPAARAAAISMSGTIGRVSSICRSAVMVIQISWGPGTVSEREEEGGSGLDPARNSDEAIDREQRDRVHRQHRRKQIRRRHERFGFAAGFCCEIVHE